MAPEVVAVFARWWDNFQESCDVRLAVGCGCAVAWVLLVALSPVVSTASTFIESGITWRSGLVAGALITFAAMAMLGSRPHVPNIPASPSPTVPLLVAAALLSPIGALLHSSAIGMGPNSPNALAAAAGFLAGCGLAALIVGWAAPFGAIRLRKRVVGTVASIFTGGALYIAIALLPHSIVFVLSLALAPASLFFAMLIERFPDPTVDGETPVPQESASEPIRPTTATARAMAAGTTTPSLAAPATLTPAPPTPKPLHPARLIGSELSLAAVVYGALFALAGHTLPGIEDAWLASTLPGLANVGVFLISETILTLYMVKRVRRENPRVAYRPATVLVAIGFLFVPFVGATGALLCMAVAFAGFGCFLVYLWIVMGNLSQRWNTAPLPTAAFGFALLFLGIVLGEAAAWILYRDSVAIGYPATVSIVSLFMLVVLAWNMTDGSRYAQETVAMGGVPIGSENGNGQGALGNADAEASTGGAATPADDAKLRAATETYGLSPREVEVVALLLRGRFIPYICDELFIAKSTAQTHVRHIYAKMDITGGRQELLDRLETGITTNRPFPGI